MIEQVTEGERAAAIARLSILDTAPEQYFDDIAAMAAQICGTPMAMFSLIDTDRQWIKAKVGLDVSEAPRDISFCSVAVDSGTTLFEIRDARTDPRFENHPWVAAGNLSFYAGAPIMVDQHVPVGVLCVVDARPRSLSDDQRRALLALKRQVESGLLSRMNLRELHALQEREKALTSLLVHDVKNPLTVVLSCTEFLRSQPAIKLDAEMREAVDDASRAAAMCLERIVRTLDTARPAGARSEVDCCAMVENLAREYRFRAANKRQDLVVRLNPVRALLVTDVALVRRMLENLLVNALHHAPMRARVELSLEVLASGAVEFRVDDSGQGIPEAARARVFDSHVRLDESRAGHGLGLAMVKQGAESLGGSACVTASPLGGARFVLTIPNDQ